MQATLTKLYCFADPCGYLFPCKQKRLAHVFFVERTRDSTHKFKEPAFLTFLGMLPSNSGKVITRRAFPSRNTTTVASICRLKSWYLHAALLCNITCKAQSIESETNFYRTKENPPDQCQHISKRGTCLERLLFSKDSKHNVLFTCFFYYNYFWLLSSNTPSYAM